jgi:SAM-dependent methyltransferase
MDESAIPRILDRPPELARSFNQIPDDYEARPPYPDWVFALLADTGALGPGTRALEIGAGTGQATLPLLDRGATVTAVEPGADLARRLAERTAGRDVQIIVSPFERASIPASSYDLVASATAFHWVDPDLGPSLCARVLRGGGWLALWWTIWGDPERADPFHDALEPILRAKAPQLVGPGTDPRVYRQDLAARAERVEATGAFDPVRREVFDWHGDHDPVALRRVFATFGAWLALPEPLRSDLLDDVERIAADDFGGHVRRPYQTVAYLAQRRT